MNPFMFQVWPALFVFSESRSALLLGRRREQPVPGHEFGPVSGPMHHGDVSIADCLTRIKQEQLGQQCQLRLFLPLGVSHLYTRRDGRRFILAYYPALYLGGAIAAGAGFSEHVWSSLKPAPSLEPGVDELLDMSRKLELALRAAESQDCVDI